MHTENAFLSSLAFGMILNLLLLVSLQLDVDHNGEISLSEMVDVLWTLSHQ